IISNSILGGNTDNIYTVNIAALYLNCPLHSLVGKTACPHFGQLHIPLQQRRFDPNLTKG
ncbi:hypothetical protein ACFLW3_02030, partial [Chloroflexota bacterium]